MRAAIFILISVGCIITVFSTMRYQRFWRYNREAAYRAQQASGALSTLLLLMMYLFIVGYVAGMLDVALREVEPIYNFVAVIFFVGGIFIALSIDSQISLAKQLRSQSMGAMRTFVNAIDLKDAYTHGHSHQVYLVTQLLYMRLDDSIKKALNAPKLFDAAFLHDIGKIAVPEDVLNKKGALSPEDWELVKTHPANGKRMLDDTLFKEIGDWVLYHHERMDGRGYYRLPSSKIPMESRIIAVADTYCALCTDRVYRPRYTHEEAIGIMEEAAGTQIDGTIFAALQKVPVEDLLAVL